MIAEIRLHPDVAAAMEAAARKNGAATDDDVRVFSTAEANVFLALQFQLLRTPEALQRFADDVSRLTAEGRP